jgi:hypothetical protein
MANPTTNYGFVLPTSTDLVTDLPADFDVALQGVDTRLKALQPGTTLGDLAYSSATANTNTRLGVGSTGQVLTVSGGVPSWATPAGGGGMTLLSTTTLSGASTITISSINQSYVNLLVYTFGVTNATANSGMSITPNNTTGVADYFRPNGASAITTNVNDNPSFNDTGNLLRTSNENAWVHTFYNYSSTTAFKPFQVSGGYLNTSSVRSAFIESGIWRSNSAITSLQLDHYGGNFSTGTVLVYGVK